MISDNESVSDMFDRYYVKSSLTLKPITARVFLDVYFSGMTVNQVYMCLDVLNVPEQLSYEERLAYYKLFVKGKTL